MEMSSEQNQLVVVLLPTNELNWYFSIMFTVP